VHGNKKKGLKTRALAWGCTVYKDKEETPDFEKFYLPFGGHLNGENRWVKLSEIIPWEELEAEYKGKFSKHIGRTAKTVRLAFGAILIKEKLKTTDEETVEMIKENPYLQFFLGYESYKGEKPFDPSMMVHFRRRLGPEEIKRINEIIAKRHHENIEIQKAAKRKSKKKDDDNDKNQGQLIIDATCVPQDIRFPHDVTLLDEARRKTEEIIDTLYEATNTTDKKPRTHRKRARVEYLAFIRGRRRTTSEIRKATRKQLQYLKRNLNNINKIVEGHGSAALTNKQRRDLMVIHEVFRQQYILYKKRTHSIAGKIMSIAQPHVRAIARGKARAAFEFGAKVSASVTENGMMYIDRLSWEAYNEAEDLPIQVELYRARFGHYPESVHADKIYRTRKNREYCKEREIRLSGPHLGRPLLPNVINQKQIRLMKKIQRNDEGIRQTVEGCFGRLKRKYSLANVYEKLRVTSETTIMVCMLLANCDKILRDLLLRLFRNLQSLVARRKYLSITGVDRSLMA